MRPARCVRSAVSQKPSPQPVRPASVEISMRRPVRALVQLSDQPKRSFRGAERVWTRMPVMRGWLNKLFSISPPKFRWPSASDGVGFGGEFFEALGRIVVENPAAAFARHDAVAALQILKVLQAQQHIALRAATVYSLGNADAAAILANPLILGNDFGRHFAHDARPLLFQLFDFLLIRSGTLAGLVLFGFDLFGFLGQDLFGGFYVLIEGLGFGHELQNAVLEFADFSFAEVDFVLEGAILLVGFRVHHL